MKFQYYRERLDDLNLLDRAVPVPLSGDGFDLAVPVGGRRRSGVCDADPVRAAHAIVSMLAQPEEFPDLRWADDEQRLRWGVDPEDAIPQQQWETEPRVPELSEEAYMRVMGILYGYSDEAIQKFIRHHGFAEDGQ
ncbi:DUF6302 family protein [Streptomyces violaceusniger]|nr:DUF6302 family protein [Streptomyces violaceusniger]